MKHRIIKAIDSKNNVTYHIQRKDFLWGWLYYNTCMWVKGKHNSLEEAKEELDRIEGKNIIIEVVA